MPPKKKSGGITNAEKQRLYRERRRLMHPGKEDENKLKDKKRYHSKKRLINDLSERGKRLRRKNTREKVKRFREKKKAEKVVPTDPSKNTKKKLGRKKVRRDRSRVYKENQLLKKQLEIAKRKVDKHRKRMQRMESKISQSIHKTPDIELTPKSLARKSVHECFRNGVRDAKRKVAKKLFLHNVMSVAIKNKYKKSTKIEKKHFKHVVSETLSKYNIIRPSLSMYLGLRRGFRKSLAAKQKKSLKRKKAVEAIFARDDISRATSGKKETITRKKEKRQKRFLNDSIKSLHQKYIDEGNKISYGTFRNNRPFHVVKPTNSERDTCLCKLHSNLSMKIKKLNNLKICSDSDIKNLISLIVCDKTKKDCMYRKCNICSSKEVPLKKQNINIITWFQWSRVTEVVKSSTGEEKKILKVIKEKKTSTEEELCKNFQMELKKMCKHDFNIKHQYAAYRQCRENLKTNEALILVDFSENYSCKLGEEIQSYHFGGSRNQVTLQGVLYTCESKPTSFCSISSDRRHTPAAIWAHLEPVFKMVRKITPPIQILHFFSDGPTTQYRQKQNFYLLSSQLSHYGFKKATWSFFEAGHGKAAADGVGAALKRKADELVSYGQDIMNANQFYEAVRKSKPQIFFVEEQDIDFIEKSLPSKLKAIKGTMKIHQVRTEDKVGTISYRDLSCFCGEQRGFCSCFHCCKSDLLQSLTNEIVEVIDSSPTDELLQEPGPSFKDDGDCEITPNKIQRGTFLLVELASEKKKKMKFHYVGVTQDDLEDDGEVQVMFLKVSDETGTLFKADDTDIAYIEFEQIKSILPMPTMVQKGDRFFYKFPYSIAVFEK